MSLLLATSVVGCIALVLLVPAGVLFTEVLLAVLARRAAPPGSDHRPRVAILMPAHNESAVIAGTLKSIGPQLTHGDRLLVVADNCSDDTAALAAAAGAEVVSRRNAEQRGKGYALDFGIRHLAADPPDVVIIVDADCQVQPGCIERLTRLSARIGRPVQALYLMHAPAGTGAKMRVAEFAWLVKNQVRPLGLYHARCPCQMMGTGMAFPWSCLQSADLASGHIVEDLKLGLDLARADHPPLFCPEAIVTSRFPISSEGIETQRTRWEHGHLSVILNEAPRLLLHSLVRVRMDLLALALDLCVPPLTLLVLLVMAAWLGGMLLYVFSGTLWPLACATGVAALLAAAVALSWACYGRRVISLGALLSAAGYALWKIPIYVRFLLARQVDWVRSKRDSGTQNGE